MKQIKIILGSVLCLIVSLVYADEGKILYQSDFIKTGLQDLRQVPFKLHGQGDEEGKWSVRDGSIVNEDGGLLLMGSDEWKHYTLELTYKVVESQNPYPWPGIIVRYIDSDNFISLLISPKEHYWRIFDYTNGHAEVLDGSPNLPGKMMNKPHRVRIECRGDTITFHFDGKLIITVKQPSPPGQGIGLVGAKKTTTIFSDIVVREIDYKEKYKTVSTIGSESERLPSYTVKKTEEKIEIDGLMKESSWEKAEEIKFSYSVNEKEKAKGENTYARLLWDKENLYVFFKCKDKNIWAEYKERDSKVYLDDCVEIFISPDSEKVHTYFNLEINACGFFLDHARIVDERHWRVLVKWNADMKLGHIIRGTLNDNADTDQYWTMEASIPFKNFARVSYGPKPGDTWRLNLNRINRLGKKRKYQYSQWSVNQKRSESLHTPGMFGFIHFSGNEKDLNKTQN